MNRRAMMGAGFLAVLAFIVGSFTLYEVAEDDTPSATSTRVGSNSAPSGDSDRKGSSTDEADKNADERNAGVTNGDGSEVIKQPDGSGTDGLPGLTRKAPSPKASLLTLPLPKTASSVGAIVAGFPVAVVPVDDASAVQTSGVSVEDRRLQVSVEADDSRTPTKVFAFYRSALTAKGFREAAAPAVGGSTAAAFSRGDDNLVLTVRPRNSNGTSFSVFGTLHAAKG